jgi:hypothetical protein
VTNDGRYLAYERAGSVVMHGGPLYLGPTPIVVHPHHCVAAEPHDAAEDIPDATLLELDGAGHGIERCQHRL